MQHLGENTVTELLSALVTPARRAEIDSHTAECATCRRLISELVRRTASVPHLAAGTPGGAVPRHHAAGTRVDRYTLGARLGAGASGTVVEAHDPELDRTVALKLLHSGDEQRDRIQREARALAKLAHPNVVAVHDAGTFEGELFVAMELVDGTDLRTWLKTPRTTDEVLAAFRQIAAGLAAAHAAGIVHRDVKPENILVGKDGRVRVADFGLAGGPTGAADFIGTPAYMAPEQFEDGIAGTGSDQFAYCVSLYEALHGKRPFPINLVEEVAPGPPRDPARRLPAYVRAVLVRGLAPDPAQRFPSMDDVLAALQPRRGRRIAAVAAIAALAVGAAGFAAARLARPAVEPCADVSDELDVLWNPVREAALHTRFLATALPYAEGTWHAVDRSLGAFAREYRTMRGEACTATRVRGVQSEQLLDLRMQCLDRARAELGGVLDLVAGVSRTDLATMPSTVDGLPALAACANTTALLAPVPPPTGGEAIVVKQLGLDIARASALADAGRWRDTLASATPIVERARTLNHSPTRAAALFLLGRAQSGAGDAAAAESSLRDAYAAAEVGHDDLLAARAAIELVYVVGQTQSRYKDGGEWAFHAQSLLQRAGGDAELEARLAGNQGHLAFATSDYPGARTFYERALAIRERTEGAQSRGAATSLGNVARALVGVGDNARALELSQRTIAALEHALGPQHPDVALALNGLGTILNNQGEFAAALSAFDRSLAIAEPALGRDHPQVGETLINRGYVLVPLGRPDEAIVALDRAIAIFERSGADPNHLAAALAGKGDVQLSTGRPGEALATYERMLAIAIELDPENDVTANAMESVAGVKLALDRAADALVDYQRALAIREKVTGADYWENAYAHAGIGDAHVALGHWEQAVGAYRKAVGLLEHYDGDPVTRATTRLSLARALDRSHGDPREVRELLATSERELVAAGDTGAEALAQLRAWHPSR